MGAGLDGLVFAVVVLVVLAALVFVLAPWVKTRQRQSDAVNDPAAPTLEYRVPASQDPAVVLAALHGEGYEATIDRRDTHLVRVACPAGVDRERPRVRAVISTADSTSIDHGAPVDTDHIRFTDE